MVYVPVHGSYILDSNMPNRAEIIQYITTDEVNIPCDKCFHFFPSMSLRSSAYKLTKSLNSRVTSRVFYFERTSRGLRCNKMLLYKYFAEQVYQFELSRCRRRFGLKVARFEKGRALFLSYKHITSCGLYGKHLVIGFGRGE